MCKVASGIDSQVLGEQEIFGQFKTALRNAKEYKIIGNKLSYFADKVIEIAKKARTDTEIGLNSLSVSGLAMKLIKNIFEAPENQNILVIGAGSLSKSVIENLYDKGIRNIKLVNRTVKKINLGKNFEILSSSLDSLHDQLELADIVISSSITEVPLIGKGAIENALKFRKNKPILLIDLGVPRNIEDEIRGIEQAYLYSIDDIEKITQENFGQRSIEAEKAMNIIALESKSKLEAFSEKSSKDLASLQLDQFLNSLSSHEIQQFKTNGNYSNLVDSIKSMNIANKNLNDFQDLKNLDDHVIKSMIKGFLVMHDSMLKKLEQLQNRINEIQDLLLDSKTIEDIDKYTLLNKEFSELKPIVEKFDEYNNVLKSIKDANEIIESGDDDLKVLAEDDLKSYQDIPEKLEQELKFMLLPKDSADDGSAYLEIRSGAGGDEASIFAGDLFRMYSRLSERQGWDLEVIDIKPSEQGGLKEVVAKLNGKSVFKVLKFESGVHRVQRVPETESQGRVHTSTCTVAVLPEVEEVQDINIDKNDLRVDTFRASGAGGQHVNKTDSAVRLTHIPTGLVVECQDGRSQHKNKEKALSLLAAKLKQQEIDNQQESIASERKILVGTGDRSEKIRTYNFPQGRMTDHRIKLTQHNLDQIMDGDIKEICDALLAENQLAMLSQLESE